MSKMRMPEMSVVRFNESDVIVASTLGIYNFADGVERTGYMTYRGNTYNYGNHNDLIKIIVSPNVALTSGGNSQIDTMFWSELDDGSQFNVVTEDGEYEFRNGAWTHQ